MKVLVIDNYDSFTYNLVQMLGSLGVKVQTLRNDHPLLGRRLEGFDALFISPGPSRPEKAGFTLKAIEENAERLPIFGICLGHQALGLVFGAKLKRAKRILHGKVSPIYHNGTGIFQGLPSPFSACRYHSLVLEELPQDLEATAYDDMGEIMAIVHRRFPLFGVQFHPEAYLTEKGKELLGNFLKIAREART